MKRITATLIVLSALSAPALAETPTDRQMHSWDYVQQVANPMTPQSAPVMERHEQHQYYSHPSNSHMKHTPHHGAMHHHHTGKKMAHKHHHTGKMHHHHHHVKKDTTTTTTTTTTPAQTK